MSTVNYIGASDYIYLTFSHSTDVTLAVYGEIWGVQHAGCDVTLVDDSD